MNDSDNCKCKLINLERGENKSIISNKNELILTNDNISIILNIKNTSDKFINDFIISDTVDVFYDGEIIESKICKDLKNTCTCNIYKIIHEDIIYKIKVELNDFYTKVRLLNNCNHEYEHFIFKLDECENNK